MTSEKMDEELRNAAVNGDVGYLKSCIKSNKPIEYYLTSYPRQDDQSGGKFHFGNIFHVAAAENKEDFISKAMTMIPVEAKQQLLVQLRDEEYRWNPLHEAARVGNIEIVKMFLDVYRGRIPSDHTKRPWLMKISSGNNACGLALFNNHEECALEIFRMDTELISNMPSFRGASLVYEAISENMSKLALEILRCPNHINCAGYDGYTPFHVINYIEGSENFCTQLIEGHPDLIKVVDKKGTTIIHSWIKSDKEWLFKFILESKWKVPFVKLIVANDYNDRNNLFHVAATTTHEKTIPIIRMLVEAFKDKCLNFHGHHIHQLPWFEKNKEDEGPLHLAIRNQREELALYILSLHEDDDISKLLDYYEPEHSILFLAIQCNCPRVAEQILSRLDKETWTKYLKDPSDGHNVLHLATSLTGVLYRWVQRTHSITTQE